MPSPAEGPVKPSVKLPYSQVPEHDHDEPGPVALALAPVHSDNELASLNAKPIPASHAIEPEQAPTHWSDMFKLPPLNAEERNRMKVAPDGSPLYEPHQGANRQYMRDIILGVNDGLISVFLLLIGLAGGGVGSREILLAGITSALAGAISMALGEYLATKSQAEVYAGDIELEKRHFKYFRASEIHQLRTIFEHDLHLEGELLEQVVAKIGADDDALLKVMMAFEFGLNEQDQRSPIKAMMMCGCLFITGSSLSWLPFCFTEDVHFAITIASLLCGFGMFIVGAFKTVATRGNWVCSGLENFCVGAIGAGVSYGLGVLYDVLRDKDD